MNRSNVETIYFNMKLPNLWYRSFPSVSENHSEQNSWLFDGTPGVNSSSCSCDTVLNMDLIWTSSGPHQASYQKRGRWETA